MSKPFMAGFAGGISALLAVAALQTGIWIAAAYQASRPFHIHRSDVRQWGIEGPVWIRCPHCLGRLIEPGSASWDFNKSLCTRCDARGMIAAAALARPILVVPVDDPTDYSSERL